MKLRVKFTKENYLKYLSHLDLMRLFQRAFNRAKVPVKYSEGFNPQPRFSIGAPLSLGISSEEEYMDIELYEYISEERFLSSMNQVLPQDVRIINCKYTEDLRAIASLIIYADYEYRFILSKDTDSNLVVRLLEEWYEQEKIIVERLRRHKRKDLVVKDDVKKRITEFEILMNEGDILLNICMETGSNGNVRPFDLVESFKDFRGFNNCVEFIDIKRTSLYIMDEKLKKTRVFSGEIE